MIFAKNPQKANLVFYYCWFEAPRGVILAELEKRHFFNKFFLKEQVWKSSYFVYFCFFFREKAKELDLLVQSLKVNGKHLIKKSKKDNSDVYHCWWCIFTVLKLLQFLCSYSFPAVTVVSLQVL